MATTASSHTTIISTGILPAIDPERGHRLRLVLAWIAVGGLIAFLAVYGFSYYRLDLPSRAYSSMHPLLRPSGVIGVRLGILGLIMFLLLYLYPLRKHWEWLAQFGQTKHWLDFHVLLGITAPLVITLHSSFKLNGLAGVAYWIMVLVALSGFIGRYLYAQIPRRISTVEMSSKEMEKQMSVWALQLARQSVLTPAEMAPLLALPTRAEVERMTAFRALWTMFEMDVARPFQVARLRRRMLSTWGVIRTGGGLLPSDHAGLEKIIRTVRRHSWLSTKMLFLGRVHEVFHLWHVIHRPFSYSFSILVVVHIGVVMLLGYY
ncbi:MAG: hypothetical protein HYR60_07215 [Acidobacteria bacterium]|nr:hypothetical protein [Acidobacteriota bacterium]